MTKSLRWGIGGISRGNRVFYRRWVHWAAREVFEAFERDSQMATQEQVLAALAGVADPNTGKDFVSTKAVRNVHVEGGDVSFDVELGYPAKSQWPELRRALIAAAKSVPGVSNVSVNITTNVTAHAVQRGVQLMPNVKNIIAVASGKGGVGKSTTAANLALALAAEGARVGVLDADIYGPSQPMMLGIDKRPESEDGQTMEPLENHGVQVMSIGFLVNQDEAMIWRGPMATQALEQLLRQTNWDALDYLIVDMPPGTGDIQLTLSQRVPMTGAVIVTTPQDIALIDARKAVTMFEKVGVPILGVVENMAVHVCSNCGHAEHIFGAGGGQRYAEEKGIPYLGALPLDIHIREQADSGKPTVVADPDSEPAKIYRSVARQVAIRIAARAKDFSAKFPTITVSKNT
ncbi:iron-sulfur cluster carrier protein ApbC [Ramlibacter ginsenosidimutans]|uniref:iron-sulfur cluster carrier protein ApbC n=1 Tax=Ramlibacter ginsenosidimutans TaxID=502333 RepID=UPI0030F37BF3